MNAADSPESDDIRRAQLEAKKEEILYPDEPEPFDPPTEGAYRYAQGFRDPGYERT